MKHCLVKVGSAFLFAALAAGGSAPVFAQDATTAWKDGKFQVDAAGLLSRSTLILGQPNRQPNQAMPLGNGRLGVAVWSENGLTAQLNRADTLPYRLSPGWVAIPGLAALTSATDYAGKLDLYNGEFTESGGGMTATAYVQPQTDTLIIDVTGAKPGQAQTAQLKLWPPRTPVAAAKGKVGLLSGGWVDNIDPGASDRAFGALAAITAEGRDVSVAVTDPLTVTVTFKPAEDGHYRIVVASPHYDGKMDALTAAQPALLPGTAGVHSAWWHAYWKRAGAFKITSKDGSGEYIETLRALYLYAAAAEKGVEYPGTQAGLADLLSSSGDKHSWDAAAFWHWNIRMQVAANLGAGVMDLNAPYFRLYRENLANMQAWTRVHMSGHAGVCIPETMRFNGQGIEYESDWPSQFTGHLYARNCDATFTPFFNSRTLSTGAEVGLWIWQQYLATGDRAFLVDNYPVMAEAARFLLDYEKPGADGLLHMGPSNAHETQWDVTDPTTDIAAERALFPVTVKAATLLGKDADLVAKMKAALPRIPDFPRTQFSAEEVKLGSPAHSESGSTLSLLPASADAEGNDVIAVSYEPGAPNRNGENIGLELIWPYDLIGDTSPLFALAQRTYEHRLSKGGGGWSFDPIVAARLEMGKEVGEALVRSTRTQRCINGFECTSGKGGMIRDDEFYVEPNGVMADALQEALVQDYDGILRIAPAIPPGWDFDGSVFVRGKTKVDVQVRDGVATTVVIESGITQSIQLRNPWPGQAVDILSGKAGTKVLEAATGTVLHFQAAAGQSYLVQRHAEPTASRPFAAIGGAPATSARKLGAVQLGLFSASPPQQH